MKVIGRCGAFTHLHFIPSGNIKTTYQLNEDVCRRTKIPISIPSRERGREKEREIDRSLQSGEGILLPKEMIRIERVLLPLSTIRIE